ncbi:MAG: hypothetical protein Q9226_001276 [Calogaya cf. arnoldii]
MDSSSPPALLTLDLILAAVPPDLSPQKLRSYHHIAFNVANIAHFLQHSPGPNCSLLERHVPASNCPPPDVPVTRAAILPLIEYTIELCRVWHAQNLEVIEMIHTIEATMKQLCKYAGDNLVALELFLLKATEQHISVPQPNSPSDGATQQSARRSTSHHSMPSPPDTPQMTPEQEERIQKCMSKTKTPDLNIYIFSPGFRHDTLRGMGKHQLKQLVQQDMLGQGINIPVRDCMFRGQWEYVYVRFLTLEDTAKVRALFTPRKFGKGAYIKTTKMADLPPFLQPQTEAKLVAEGLEKKERRDNERAEKRVREVTVIAPDQSFAKSRLKKLNSHALKELVEADLRDQGINVSIERCKKSPGCTRIYVLAASIKDVPILLKWKPNLKKYLGRGVTVQASAV